jgi:uncharacterized iron-regulated protein
MQSPRIKINGIDQPLASGTIIDTHGGQALSFDQLIACLQNIRVIYVGERHTEKMHHRIQLNIIRGLVAKGCHVKVGMEMFDQTDQDVLNRWSDGDLDWTTFLRRTHWYANWQFDDRLYQNILAYIQEKHLPLIGLNIPFHIPPKIAVGGLENLSAQDRTYLPDQIDTTNPAHRAYLKKIFRMHNIKGRNNFEDFYAAQCAWEDGMAQAVADHLGQDVMVVLVGNGHIERKFGIPDRAFKRNQATFRTILLVPASPHISISRQDGDFIWLTPIETTAPMQPHGDGFTG